MKAKVLSIGMLAAVLVMALLFLVPVSVLTVRLPRQDYRLVGTVHVFPGNSFELEYLHSVERTKVVGRFSIDENRRLLATETRMMSVGTGMPNTEMERTRREGDWIVVDEKNRILPELRFYYASVNDTLIKIAGRPLPLETVRSGNLLRIGVESPRMIQWICWLFTGRTWRHV
jgi:hypothetical protein